jgi:hypothetical protein
VNAAKEEIYHNAKTDLQCGQNGTCQIQVDIKGIITTKGDTLWTIYLCKR